MSRYLNRSPSPLPVGARASSPAPRHRLSTSPCRARKYTPKAAAQSLPSPRTPRRAPKPTIKTIKPVATPVKPATRAKQATKTARHVHFADAVSPPKAGSSRRVEAARGVCKRAREVALEPSRGKRRRSLPPDDDDIENAPVSESSHGSERVDERRQSCGKNMSSEPPREPISELPSEPLHEPLPESLLELLREVLRESPHESPSEPPCESRHEPAHPSSSEPPCAPPSELLREPQCESVPELLHKQLREPSPLASPPSTESATFPRPPGPVMLRIRLPKPIDPPPPRVPSSSLSSAPSSPTASPSHENSPSSTPTPPPPSPRPRPLPDFVRNLVPPRPVAIVEINRRTPSPPPKRPPQGWLDPKLPPQIPRTRGKSADAFRAFVQVTNARIQWDRLPTVKGRRTTVKPEPTPKKHPPLPPLTRMRALLKARHLPASQGAHKRRRVGRIPSPSPHLFIGRLDAPPLVFRTRPPFIAWRRNLRWIRGEVVLEEDYVAEIGADRDAVNGECSTPVDTTAQRLQHAPLKTVSRYDFKCRFWA
ncbi:hypothetical protein CC85DRAFT_303474 [Cutaneotrichosporon oleaginosum]|uniref:Uncharacterized protein n=1 Tax=Cutaneotrichosporon oleaginosum TaxID=879819 RepID=A0A0J0XJ83_9TREE|nr:uncharacterized protein CC85DRAFT_303474 [Cutaneotrichosporon oleaginosum]KLT41165.1 hypothetical protein CC85DRAFT_303474 [Cutaneotrichosporon oleaginosum]TXT14117.1 hypothetical protein COLE_00310 [Cutaneotrichosporon oleaginosum]